MEKSNAAEPYSPSSDAAHTVTTGDSMYTSTSGQAIEKEAMEVHHIRANMQQRWVSAEDFMSYVDPTLTECHKQADAAGIHKSTVASQQSNSCGIALLGGQLTSLLS